MDLKDFPSQEQIKFISSALLEIIRSQEMMRSEIIGTVELWAKNGWQKEKDS